MKKLLTALDGNKTYISSVILAAYGVVKVFGVNLTQDQDIAIIALIMALFGMSIRSAMNK